MEYLIGTTFLLLGFIIGAIASGVIIYRYFIDRDYREFDNPTEEFDHSDLPDFIKKNMGHPIPLEDFMREMGKNVNLQKTKINQDLVNESKVKKLIEVNIEKAKKEERWSDLTDLNELYNTIEDWFEPRKK